MANHKSAMKRNRQNTVRRARNRANRSRVNNVIRAVDKAISDQLLDEAQAALQVAIPVIQKVASKGVMHKKNASRKVSRLTIRVNKFVAAQSAA